MRGGIVCEGDGRTGEGAEMRDDGLMAVVEAIY